MSRRAATFRRSPPTEEISRVSALVSALSREVLVSIDTYKFEVAEAAVAAGASIVNDVSGLRDVRLAELCARTGAALVVMHTAVEPKGTLLDPGTYEDVAASVLDFLRSRLEVARAAGVGEEQLILDPGPDFAKTPAQTVAMLRRLSSLRSLGRPILLAASRKDFIGAITGRAAPDRDPGTLAALAFGDRRGRRDPARARRRRRRRLPRRARGPARRARVGPARRADAGALPRRRALRTSR